MDASLRTRDADTFDEFGKRTLGECDGFWGGVGERVEREINGVLGIQVAEVIGGVSDKLFEAREVVLGEHGFCDFLDEVCLQLSGA